jgi:hypothetical protein
VRRVWSPFWSLQVQNGVVIGAKLTLFAPWRRVDCDARTCSAANVERRFAAVPPSAKTDDRSRSGGNAALAESLALTAASANARPGHVDVFAGTGCVADGFAAGGFDPLALLDIDGDARRTYV